MMPPRLRRLISLTLTIGLLAASCGDQNGATRGNAAGGKTWNAVGAAREYQLVQAELKLATLEKPYLAIRFDLKKLQLKLKGTVLWEYSLDLSGVDRDDITEFVDQFHGHESRSIRVITETHLFAARGQTPDSILAIVSEVTKFKPELMQRELPERFQLLWGNAVVLEIRTNVAGKPVSQFKNTIFEVRHALQSPFGKAQVTVKMDPTYALTLYRAAQPGMPTIVFPPSS